ncbi:Na(+)-translocating NADH-quinone reductase subunit C [Methylobacter sp. YRD-M1]|uniref:Na(+)-translocating NADH-quinone reductase subunit C n=1 Tax=Methylobacter sp. YRD-M1 TaxID=2911520 RepID=UPI00227CE6EB|nr:Na(+)-translocating NADH-quinone reductase subunit C [Methylobacter sp. YRD-M1]WAK00589.1 Na(+)-translocating NADH-quinone reductase subunit C [Methylobacter sp. YRD-M1]
MRKDSVRQAILIVLGVSLICSLFVSAAAILLHATQRHNQRLDRISNILAVADLYEEDADLDAIYEQNIESLMVDLQSGKAVDPAQFDERLNIESFDIEALAFDPDYGEVIPPQYDQARIKQRPKYMVVYLVKTDRQLQKLILPVYGKGLWSTLYGFIALDKDLRTITGLTFYEHKETPGLGGEVDNPRWKGGWKGKQAFDAQGRVIVEVTRGDVAPDSDEARHQVSGIAGATITSRGVNNLVRYWLGEHGYGPFLSHLEQGRISSDLARSSRLE